MPKAIQSHQNLLLVAFSSRFQWLLGIYQHPKLKTITHLLHSVMVDIHRHVFHVQSYTGKYLAL